MRIPPSTSRVTSRPHLTAIAAVALGTSLAFAGAPRAAAADDMMMSPTPMASASMPVAPASAAAKPSGIPSAAEAPFVASVASDLARRFPTPAAAERAGYLRYTNEDSTGAISYANRQWTSADTKHPSQLWYDVTGRLLGADFSVLKANSPQAPQRFGVDPARWGTFHAHVHLGVREPDGTIAYRGIGKATIEKGGGTLADPTPEALVKAGIAPDARHVAFVFAFPAIWDLSVWVLPNPNGAFADANPNVHPVHPQKDAG